jgi:hypothetical protein
MAKNKQKENSYYERILSGDRSSGPSVNLTGEQFQGLLNKQSPYGNAFGSSSDSSSGSMLGIRAGQKALTDVAQGYQNFGKDIKGYESYLSRAVQRGTMAPELAEQSYLNAARFGNVKDPYTKAEKLGSMAEGFVDPAKYEKFKPFMQLTAKDLLGRQLSGDEMTNYIEAARGLGISKGQDFAAFLGNTVLTSPEARSRAVVTSKGLFDKTPNLNLMA